MALTNIFTKMLQLLKKYHFHTNHYNDRKVALLTQHGKESVLAPILKESIGCIVTKVKGYDTDLLGTFTRDIPRIGTQIEAARKKARIGIKLAKLPLGLASEGSFGPDPFTGMFSWNVEVLVWIDDENKLEIIATAQGKTNQAHSCVTSWEEIEAFANKVGFPEHHLIIRPQGENDPNIRKGIASWDELSQNFIWAQSYSNNGSIFVETDMRAHANPTRMNTIGLAAKELAKKLSSVCPSCGSPGYWIIERIAGLKCERCGQPTQVTRAEIYGCSKCGYKATIERTDLLYANPGHCDYCNP
jgi:hypothetical protein